MGSATPFSFDFYKELLSLLVASGYECAGYGTWQRMGKLVILRHDIDQSISKALDFARLESDAGATSTYFVLLTSDFYNPHSARSVSMLKEIKGLGHDVGLHFDETVYQGIAQDPARYEDAVAFERRCLEESLGFEVKSVSMHRPSPASLSKGETLAGMVNSYSETFFKEFKYLSDSRRRWREPVMDIVSGGAFNRLHVLTHAFWYSEIPRDARETVELFLESAKDERMEAMRDNITDINGLIGA